MYVAAAVQHIEHLTSLRHGAKQRIVAARSFLLLVKANGPVLSFSRKKIC